MSIAILVHMNLNLRFALLLWVMEVCPLISISQINQCSVLSLSDHQQHNKNMIMNLISYWWINNIKLKLLSFLGVIMFSSFCYDDNVICFGKYCNPNLRYYIHQLLTRIQLTATQLMVAISVFALVSFNQIPELVGVLRDSRVSGWTRLIEIVLFNLTSNGLKTMHIKIL